MTHSACILIMDSSSVWCGPTRHPSLVAQLVKNLPAVQETWVWSLAWKDPLEKEMATHSSILTWRIPWTEEPGGIQSMRSQRVGHDCATSFHFLFSLDIRPHPCILPHKMLWPARSSNQNYEHTTQCDKITWGSLLETDWPAHSWLIITFSLSRASSLLSKIFSYPILRD